MARRAKKDTRTRRRYTEEERAAAVGDVPALGVRAAARKHGVPESCVSYWAKAVGVTRTEESRPSGKKEPARNGKNAARASKAKAAGTETDRSASSAKREQPAKGEPEVAAPVRRTLKSRVAKVYTPSQKAVVLEDAAKDSVTEAAEKHGVSRFSIYAWQRKVAKAAAGEGPSPTSGPAPAEIEAQRDKEILDEWHRHPGLGPSQISNQLRRKSIKVERQHRAPRDGGRRVPPAEGRAQAARPALRGDASEPPLAPRLRAPQHPPGQHFHADPDR